MRSNRWTPCFVGVLCLLSCGDATPRAFQTDVRFSPTPPLVGEARVILTVRDSAGTPVSGATVVVSAMPLDAGSQYSAPATADREGSYVVSAFRFDAPGEWDVEVTVTTPEGRQGSEVQRIRVSGMR